MLFACGAYLLDNFFLNFLYRNFKIFLAICKQKLTHVHATSCHHSLQYLILVILLFARMVPFDAMIVTHHNTVYADSEIECE